MSTKVKDIIDAIERVAPAALQEGWDNTGLQIGDASAPVSRVLAVVDVTPDRVAEAVDHGCEMIVSHHPLIFKGLKHITGTTQVERAVAAAISAGIAVYSSHTALDNAADGVSAAMAATLGATVVSPLVPTSPGAPTGTGVVAELPFAVGQDDFVSIVKTGFGNRVLRCTRPGAARRTVRRVALCGGSGGEFIPDALACGADAYVTGDIRYHDFVDYGSKILLVDAGHFETECATRNIFERIIGETCPDVEVIISKNENNSVKYY